MKSKALIVILLFTVTVFFACNSDKTTGIINDDKHRDYSFWLTTTTGMDPMMEVVEIEADHSAHIGESLNEVWNADTKFKGKLKHG